MSHDEIQDTIGAYCLGALDEAEKAALEAHLKSGCPECEAILKEMQEVVGGLAFAAAPQKPPPHLKESIFAAIEPVKTSAPPLTRLKDKVEDSTVELLQRARQRWMRLTWGLALTTAVILFVLGLYSRNLKNKIAQLEKRLQVSEQVASQLRTELTEQESIIKVMQSDEIRLVEMQGQEPSPDASGKVFWDPVNRQAVVSVNLPSIPSDKDYQLWMLRGGEAIDAGIFSLDAEGVAVFKINTIADSANLTAFAVSLEPKGGVPQPTGAIYLVGAVTRG